MSIGTLEAILNKGRKLTSSVGSNQLTDGAMIDALNSFYIYDFPAEFRSLDLKDIYTFNTIKGIDTYPFDKDHWVNVQEPAYIAKREISFFNNPNDFYSFNFSSNSQWQTDETLTSTSGNITAVTLVGTDPVVITSASHALAVGYKVTISGVVGATELNGNTYTISVVTADTFTLNGTDSSLFTAYTSGGSWVTNAVIDTLQSAPLLRSINNNAAVTTKTANVLEFPEGFPPSFTDPNINRIQNILITVNIANGTTLHVTDDGNNNLIGDVDTGVSAAGNVINYETGAVSFAFSQTIPAGEVVRVLYRPVTLEIPLSIIFFQNQFTLSPVPDKGYTVELVGYRLPSQALLGSGDTIDISGRPELQEWWETLAVGMSKKIYEDRLDMDGVSMMDKMLQERYQLNYTRTYANLGKNRVETMFTDQLQSRNGSGPFGFGNF